MAQRTQVPDAAAVDDRLVRYAFAGDIAWNDILQADSLEKAKRGLALLFERKNTSSQTTQSTPWRRSAIVFISTSNE